MIERLHFELTANSDVELKEVFDADEAVLTTSFFLGKLAWLAESGVPFGVFFQLVIHEYLIGTGIRVV